jgi:hypothetical protein
MSKRTKPKPWIPPAWAFVSETPAPKWEYLIPPDLDPDIVRGPVGMRRIRVVGGWLYQIQCAAWQVNHDESLGWTPDVGWHPPTFVRDSGMP